MDAEQRAVGLSAVAAAGLGEPDELGELGEGDVGADFALGVEQRFGGDAAELEAAAESGDGRALGVGVARGDARRARR
ncbi:MAG: hypothetical protein MZV65_25495 [Chromatiales bacterium]|nr:hypothetical protein [Chromatiales bacterium]